MWGGGGLDLDDNRGRSLPDVALERLPPPVLLPFSPVRLQPSSSPSPTLLGHEWSRSLTLLGHVTFLGHVTILDHVTFLSHERDARALLAEHAGIYIVALREEHPLSSKHRPRFPLVTGVGPGGGGSGDEQPP